MNILFCSAGRRVELLKDFRKSMDDGDRIVAADLSELAPALYVADAHYLVPRIDDPSYLDTILSICRKSNQIEIRPHCIVIEFSYQPLFLNSQFRVCIEGTIQSSFGICFFSGIASLLFIRIKMVCWTNS